MNYNVILIRYGELMTKRKNRNDFINLLIKNINIKLIKFRNLYLLKRGYDRLFIELIKIENSEEIVKIIKNIFGISSISLAVKINKQINTIAQQCLDFIRYYNPNTFKLEVHRNDKTFFINSMKIKQIIASIILKNNSINVKVNVNNPDLQICIEIRKDYAYLFVNKIRTLGGLPVGISGNGLVMLSGGIDSPVASFLIMKRGMNVQYLHFATPPYTSDNVIWKIKKLISKLLPYDSKNQQILHVVNFTILQSELMHISKPSHRIIIMRRMFFRIANILANKFNFKTLITGESLGQVASQTIESICLVNNISTLPILRPLICFDKIDIIKIARQIDTYKISIMPFDDCCSLFVPKKPVIKPKKTIVEMQEEKIIWEDILNIIIERYVTTYIVKENEELKINDRIVYE